MKSADWDVDLPRLMVVALLFLGNVIATVDLAVSPCRYDFLRAACLVSTLMQTLVWGLVLARVRLKEKEDSWTTRD